MMALLTIIVGALGVALVLWVLYKILVFLLKVFMIAVFVTAIVAGTLWLTQNKAHADWVEVVTEKIESPTLFVDYSTVEHDAVWILIDYDEPALSGSLSTKIQLQFDCQHQVRRFAAYMTFSDHMAQGDRLFIETPAQLAHEPWVPVPWGSAAHEIMSQVCSKGVAI